MGDIDFHAIATQAWDTAEANAGNDSAPSLVEDGVDAGVSIETAAGVPVADAGSGTDAAGASAPSDTGARARDASGKFLPKGKEIQATAPKQGAVSGTKASTQPAPSTTTATPPAVGGDSSQTPQPAPGQTTRSIRAPQSWTPAEREHFAKAPPEVQAAIDRVEQDTRRILSESAGARRLEKEFTQAVAPFEGLFRQSGMTPVQAAQSAFGTIQQLVHGTPQSRADVFAKLMETYPTDYHHLDKRLSGAPEPQQQQQQLSPEAIAAQAEERVWQRINGRQAEAVKQQAMSELEDFASDPTNEFFQDVGPEVLAIWQGAKARGKTVTLKQAYDSACRANPDVWDTLQRRATAEAEKARTASTQQSRVASSLVKSTPTTAASSVKVPKNHRDIVAAAWDALDR